MAIQPLPEAKLLGAYCQVSDLRRSLGFYRDVMGLEVSHSDDTLAILHGRGANPDSIILRRMDAPPHHLGDAGVTRLFWRVHDHADIDVAEKILTEHGIGHTRRREGPTDGLSFRDPDGLDIVLIYLEMKKADASPPGWLSWAH
jgi:catechol 2,3-dioxygenase-like lactoylglutathione lyase family enzyme